MENPIGWSPRADALVALSKCKSTATARTELLICRKHYDIARANMEQWGAARWQIKKELQAQNCF